MSAKSQHEFHPDAEMLSAFAGQALNAKERGEVLEHLAVCGRCRQVVALASEAASAEVAAAQPARVRPRVWWTSWGFALVPAAALAAAAVVVINVHERNVERSAEVAKLEQQRAAEKAPMPPQVASQPHVQAAPPAAASPATKAAPTERPDEAQRMPIAEPEETAAAPAPEAVHGLVSAREEAAAPPGAESHGSMGEAFAPAETLADNKTRAEIAVYEEERKKETEREMEARDKRLFAAKAPTKASLHGSENGAPGSSEQVVVSAQQLETQPAPAVSAGSLTKFRSGAFSGVRAPNPVHLPSGLPTISIAHSGERIIAVDKAGALFLSEDSGATWEPVTKQWTGRAVLVRKEEAANSAAAAPPAAGGKAAGGTSGTGTASEPATAFELFNEQSQIWWSADGRIWTAK